MQILIWRLIAGAVCAAVITIGSIALVGAVMAIVCLREWYESRRSGE